MGAFDLNQFIILGVLCFLASFIDAIAGGGGMISLPAFIATGIDPHVAIGTNKVAASFGAYSSFLKFLKAKKVNMELVKKTMLFTVIGAVLGVWTVSKIESKFLLPLIFVLILILIVYTLYNKKIGNVNEFQGLTDKNIQKGRVMALVLGFYDGFLGPGTGSFLIFALIKIFKFDFVNASGNAKALNFGSNIVSVILWVFLGKVAYIYALPMALIMYAGAQTGAHFAIKKGSKFIKFLFVVVSVAVAIKMSTSFINYSRILEIIK